MLWQCNSIRTFKGGSGYYGEHKYNPACVRLVNQQSFAEGRAQGNIVQGNGLEMKFL